jgi:methylmalonyl-CoA/ethylmalonyl-CoA epimerase
VLTPEFDDRFQLHHIGTYVDRIFDLVPAEKIIQDTGQGVYLSFVKLGDSLIEFLQPIDDKSPVFAASKRGQKLLHLCYQVEDLDEAITNCIANEFRLLRKPAKAVAFPEQEIAWLFHRSFGLVELLGFRHL